MEHAMKTNGKGIVLFLVLCPVSLLLLMIVLLLAGTRIWAAVQKPVIRHRVIEYLDERTAQAEYDLAVSDGYTWTADMYIPETGDTVWYREAGFGIAPSSREFGYCYTADGDPHPYPGMENYNEVPVMFGFRWEEPGGDNGCYLEHIAGNLYYYEVWF